MTGPLAQVSAALRALAREPLLHFLVIGSLIFAVDAVANPAIRTDKTIVVSAEMKNDLVRQFEDARGRPPTESELDTVIDAWLLNEVLYREARTLGLDKGDDMIRERIIHKMRLLIFSNIVVPEPTTADLQAWFDAHHDRYDEPERLNFFEVRVADPGEAGREHAEQTLQAIRSEAEGNDLRSQVRLYARRPAAAVDKAFGSGFADKLARLPTGTWSLIDADDGWHIVRIDAIEPGKPAAFAEVRDQIAAEWKQEQLRSLARDAVHKLGAHYDVQRLDKQG